MRARAGTVGLARALRRGATRSERLLWERLRGRRFLGLKFRRQHPIGSFVLDFYCVELRLAIEVDGSVHAVPSQARRDRGRQGIIEELGVTFVRVTARDVEEDLDRVLRELRRGLPHPLPSPHGRGPE